MSNENLGFKISGMLDIAKSTAKINEQLIALEGKINRLNLKINIDTSNITAISEQLNKQLSGNKAGNLNNEIKTANGLLVDQYKTIVKNADGTIKSTQEMRKYINELKQAVTITDKLSSSGEILETKIKTDPQLSKTDTNMNGVDYLIKQKEIQAEQFSQSLKSQMEMEVAEEKELITSKQKTLELEKQVALFKEEKLNSIESASIGKEAVFAKHPEALAEMNQLKSDLSQVGTIGGKSFAEINLQQAKWNTTMKAGSNELSQLRNQSDSFGTSLIKNFNKMLQWTLVKLFAVCSESDSVATNYERGKSKEGFAT